MWFTWFNNSNTNITTDTTAAGYYGGIECGFGNYNGGQIIIINDNNNTSNTTYVFDDLIIFVLIMIYLNFWHDIYVFVFFFKDGTAQQRGGNGQGK